MRGRSDSTFWDIHSGRTTARGRGGDISGTVRRRRAWSGLKRKVGEHLKRGNATAMGRGARAAESETERLASVLRTRQYGESVSGAGRVRGRASAAISEEAAQGVLARHAACSRWNRCTERWAYYRFRGPLRAAVREPVMKPVGKPDAGNRHVRFDERGWETGRRFASVPAPILDSTRRPSSIPARTAGLFSSSRGRAR